jgi:hypothetical protein
MLTNRVFDFTYDERNFNLYKQDMSLDVYFENLIRRVEESDIGNNGKDNEGFFKPTRTIILRNLKLLKDLHSKPLAKPMVKSAWIFVSENLPPEWLTLKGTDREELKKILE